MPEHSTVEPPAQRVGPPPRHQMAVMVWLAVFPTLTVLQVVVGSRLHDQPAVVRTLVLTTIAVPIVVYLLLPPLQRLGVHLLTDERATPVDRPAEE